MRAIDRLLRNRPKAGGLSLAGKIKALFANGEQGWWYDPSNFSTLYQDSAGTTPVTAVEQPVGLQLDLSKGLVLGPQLVTNGDFSAGTGWTLDAGAAIGSGQLAFSSVSSTLGARQTGVYVNNATYRVTVTIVSVTRGQVRIRINGGAFWLVPTLPGTYSQFVVAGTSGPSINTLEVVAAGTTSATIDNISVKELPGNHRFQSTSANRPVVSARVNLLTKTQEFSNAAWGQDNLTINTSGGTAPDGTQTANLMTENGVSGSHRVYQGPTTTTAGHIASFYAKYASRQWLYAKISNSAAASLYAWFDIQNGVLGNVQSGITATITSVGDGWYRCTVSVASALAGSNNIILAGAASNGNNGVYSGTSAWLMWGADLRPTNQGVGLPAYQRVNTSTDYDSTGFPIYIKPNGSNQSMQTNSINFTATDKMTVWQGVRKLSDAAGFSILTELSADVGSNNGSFSIQAPRATTVYFSYRSKGTVLADAQEANAAYAAPITTVMSCISNISGDIATLRLNGTQVAQSTADQGTGNFGTYPAYFYMRAGTSLPFNGNDYGSIARGAASTAAQITAGETYINSKTKAY
jgi:hypothetical protein